LAVTATLSPTPAPVNSTQTYEVQIRNNGPDSGHGITLKVSIAPLIDATPFPSQGACLGTDFNVELCALGDLSSGATATVSFALANHASGDYTNTAQVHGTETDAAGGNNSLSTNYKVAPDFTIVSATSIATVQAGQAASYDFTITSQHEYLNETPVMSCSGLPSKSSCSFSPPKPVNGTFDVKTTLTLSTTAPHQAALGQNLRAFYALVLLLLFGGVAAGRRASPCLSSRLAIVALLLLLTACGGGSSPPQIIPGTPPGTYTITVTAATSAFSHSANVTLVVQ
jgi:hypothetical protein